MKNGNPQPNPMTREKIYMKDDLSDKTDRELMLEIAINSNMSEKHLKRISNNVLFIVCVIVVSIIAYLALFFYKPNL